MDAGSRLCEPRENRRTAQTRTDKTRPEVVLLVLSVPVGCISHHSRPGAALGYADPAAPVQGNSKRCTCPDHGRMSRLSTGARSHRGGYPELRSATKTEADDRMLEVTGSVRGSCPSASRPG